MSNNGASDYLEGIHRHITSHLQQVSADCSARDDLLQAEIDRRFRDIRELVDERRDNWQRDAQFVQSQLDRRLDGAEKLSSQRFLDLRSAIDASLISAEKAVTKAENASDKRFESVNEFRKALDDQTRTFLPRKESDAQNISMSDRIGLNEQRMAQMASRLDLIQGSTQGQRETESELRLERGHGVSQFVAIVLALTMLVALATVIMSHFH